MLQFILCLLVPYWWSKSPSYPFFIKCWQNHWNFFHLLLVCIELFIDCSDLPAIIFGFSYIGCITACDWLILHVYITWCSRCGGWIAFWVLIGWFSGVRVLFLAVSRLCSMLDWFHTKRLCFAFVQKIVCPWCKQCYSYVQTVHQKLCTLYAFTGTSVSLWNASHYLSDVLAWPRTKDFFRVHKKFQFS